MVFITFLCNNQKLLYNYNKMCKFAEKGGNTHSNITY